MKIRNFQKTVSGFSIAEAVLALFITCCCVHLLSMTLGIVKTAQKHQPPINEVAYSYVQLEKFIKKGHTEIDPERSSYTKLVLKKKVGEDKEKPIFKNYTLEQYQDKMLRMRGQGGHVPLMLRVKNASFVWNKREFTINVTETDDKRSELTFRCDEPIKIKEDESEKKERTKE